MTTNSIKHILLAGTVCCGVAATLVACTDWDDHYDAESSVLASQQSSLWANIQSNGNLSQFASLLKLTGYDQKLSASQAYTVWAPADGTFDYEALSALGADKLRREFVENHIARNNYPATGDIGDQRIYMLNEKMMHFQGSGTYDMQGVALNPAQSNIGCNNGIVHVLQGKIPFRQNIFESLNSEQFAIDSISDYFHSYDQQLLNEQKSVPGPTVNGEITYLDSVVEDHNSLFSLYRAYIQREDSNYTMLLPTNKAWAAARERLRSLYHYVPRFEFMENTSTVLDQKKITPVELQADYLSDSLVNLNLMRDLFYNNNIHDNDKLLTTGEPDSLVSTTGSKIYRGDAALLFSGATRVDKSNGAVFVVDSLAMRPWTSWCPEVVQEGEQTRMLGNCTNVAGEPSRVTVTPARRNPAVPGTLSGDAFLLAQPSASSTRPEVDIYLSGVRSAEYSVYVVFVPATINDVNATARPNRCIITMGYVDEKGKSQEQRMRNPADNTTVFSNDPTKIDSVYLGDFTFPVAFYGTGNYYPYLRIRSNASGANFDNTLRIDCIILRPKELDTFMRENPGYKPADGRY